MIKILIKKLIIIYKYRNLDVKIKSINTISIKDIINNNIVLHDKSCIWEKIILKWKIEIWEYSYINWPNSIIHWSNLHSIKIWKFCSISWWVSIISRNDHDFKKISTSDSFLKLYTDNISSDVWWNINIGNDVWIWCNVIILPWVDIWNWVIIWAWSIVTKNIPDYAIVAWNPAKIIKYRFNDEILKELKNINWENINKNEILKITKRL